MVTTYINFVLNYICITFKSNVAKIFQCQAIASLIEFSLVKDFISIRRRSYLSIDSRVFLRDTLNVQRHRVERDADGATINRGPT